MTEEEHDDDADEDTGEVDLVMRAAVPARSHVNKPEHYSNEI